LAKAIQSCPADPEARRHYAEVLWQRGAREEAIAQLEQADRLAGEDPGLRVRLAELYLAAGRLEMARKTVEQALDLNPKLHSAWAIRGRLMRAAGEARPALADYHRALAYAPDDRQIRLEVAQLYQELQQPQDALTVLQSLADTYPPGEEPQQVLYLLGLNYTAVGRYDEGVSSLSLAALRGKPSAEILWRLAEAQSRAGQVSEAHAAARQALDLDPNHAPCRQLMDRLQTAGTGDSAPRRY